MVVLSGERISGDVKEVLRRPRKPSLKGFAILLAEDVWNLVEQDKEPNNPYYPGSG